MLARTNQRTFPVTNGSVSRGEGGGGRFLLARAITEEDGCVHGDRGMVGAIR